MGAVMYDPWRSDVPYAPEEFIEARFRPPARKHPKVGDHVLYRHRDHDDATDALVLAVQPLGERNDDPNLLFPDPWVTLTLDTINGQVRTRQSRVRGSAGWFHVEDMFA